MRPILFASLNTHCKPSVRCHQCSLNVGLLFFTPLQLLLDIIDIQWCNWYHLLSKISFKFQSPISIIHHKNVKMHNIPMFFTNWHEIHLNLSHHIVYKYVHFIVNSKRDGSFLWVFSGNPKNIWHFDLTNPNWPLHYP